VPGGKVSVFLIIQGCVQGNRLFPFITGMKTHDIVSEELLVKMGIDLGGRDTLMTEHFLNGTEVGTALHQVGGERMPERVRAQGLPDP
jgi:hypothetical protein